MTHIPIILRSVVSLAGLWPYIVWMREVRRENERRAVRLRLEAAIRGAA